MRIKQTSHQAQELEFLQTARNIAHVLAKEIESQLKEFDYVRYLNESEGRTNRVSHLEEDTLGINYIYTDDNNDLNKIYYEVNRG